MCACNPSSFNTPRAAPGTEITQVTMMIDSPGPTMMLTHTATDTEFEEKIAEAEAAAQSRSQNHTGNEKSKILTGTIQKYIKLSNPILPYLAY